MDNNLVGVTFRSYSEMWAKPLRPHQLRHTCATHLFQDGGNIVHIKDWLGHKRITTTLHYARIQNPEIAAHWKHTRLMQQPYPFVPSSS